MFNLVPLNTFTPSWNHHLYQVPEHSIILKERQMSIKKSVPRPLLPALGNSLSFFLWICLSWYVYISEMSHNVQPLYLALYIAFLSPFSNSGNHTQISKVFNIYIYIYHHYLVSFLYSLQLYFYIAFLIFIIISDY